MVKNLRVREGEAAIVEQILERQGRAGTEDGFLELWGRTSSADRADTGRKGLLNQTKERTTLNDTRLCLDS